MVLIAWNITYPSLHMHDIHRVFKESLKVKGHILLYSYCSSSLRIESMYYNFNYGG
jgi:hypothetical protein